MGLATQKVGTRYPPCTEMVDLERALAYAAATNDDNEAYRSGACAPPLFAVVTGWGALRLALADVVPSGAMVRIVHGEQDMHLHRPLVPGMAVTTTAEAYSIRPAGSSSRYTVKLTTVAGEPGEPVVEQYVTMVVRDLPAEQREGPDKPDHRFPAGARAHKVGESTARVDADQTFRYRDASGDDMAIHVDDAVARTVGLPGIIVHGLCTMAMAGQAVVKTVAGDDPTRLRRLAVRFSDFVLPGDELVTTIYDAGPAGDGGTDRHVFAFEAHSDGRRCITHGRAEVGAPPPR